MKWLLVVLIAQTPVKTDLVFESLDDCLRAEQAMRQEWVDVYNAAVKRRAEKGTLSLVRSQMVSGTCIPAR